MKSKFKKIVTIILCITLLIGFIIPNYSYIIYATDAQQEEDSLGDTILSGLGQVFDGIAGIITWPLRALIVAFGEVIRLIIGGVGAVAGDDSIMDNLDIRSGNDFI